MKKKNTVVLGILFFAAVVGFVVFSTAGTKRHRVEVCITFQGRTACRTASAQTREQALRAATDNACALISSGMTDTIQCGNTLPDSVKWLDAN